MKQEFDLPWPPSPKERPRMARVGNHVRTYTPKKTANAEAAIRLMLMEKRAKCHADKSPLSVTMTFRVKAPMTYPKKVRHPATRPDLDQYVKLLMDAGNGILWKDDAQVVELSAHKVYAADGIPSISIDVEDIA